MTKRRVTVQIFNTKNQLCWDPLIICKAEETVAELVQKALASYCKQGGQRDALDTVISIRTRNQGSSVTIADDQATVEDALGPESILTIILQHARNVLASSIANNPQLATPSSSIAPSVDLFEAMVSPVTKKQSKTKASVPRKRKRRPDRSSIEPKTKVARRKDEPSTIKPGTELVTPTDASTKRIRRPTTPEDIDTDTGAIPHSATKKEQYSVIYDSQPSAEEDSRSENGLKSHSGSGAISKKKDYHLSLSEENQHMLEKIDHAKLASQDHDIYSKQHHEEQSNADFQARDASELEVSTPQQTAEELPVPVSRSSSTSSSTASSSFSSADATIAATKASVPPASQSVQFTDENGETFEISAELLELADFLSDSEESQTATDSASKPQPVQSTHIPLPTSQIKAQEDHDLSIAENINSGQAFPRSHHSAKLDSPIKTPTKAPPRLATTKRILDSKPQKIDQLRPTPNSIPTHSQTNNKPTDYFDSPRSITTGGDIEKRPKLSSHGFYSLSSIHNQGTPLASPVRTDNAKSALEKLSQFTEGSSGEDSDTSSDDSEPSHNPVKSLKTAISKPAKESAARRALHDR